MRQVELDDDLYDYLRQHEALTGECISDYIRGLLKSRATEKPSNRVYARPKTDLAEFLAILSDAHHKYPDRFSRLADVRGRTRIYFAQSAQEIEQSGASTAPVRIPDTDWWASSNNSSALKRNILKKVFSAIGCSSEDCRNWLKLFDGAEPPPIETLQLRGGDGEDPLKI